MRIVLFAIVTFFHFVLWAQEAVPRHTETGINFPKKLGEFQRLNVRDHAQYESYIVGYRDQDADITFYVYPKARGVENYNPNISNDKLLAKAFEGVKSALHYAKEKGYYQDVSFKKQKQYKIGKDKKAIVGLKGKFVITANRGQHDSLAYLFVVSNYLFKIRATYPQQKNNKREESIDVAVKEIFAKRGAPISKSDTLLELIDQFMKDPINNRNSIKTIVTFALKSKSVVIEMRQDVAPITEKGVKYQNFLLAAYICGSLRPQLQKKIAKHHPKEAKQALIKIYKELQKHDKGFQLPTIEAWLK